MNCSNCGITLSDNDSQDSVVSTSGAQYGPCCTECWKNARICDGCFSIYQHDGTTISGEHGSYCSSCATTLVICHDCGRAVNEGDAINIGDGRTICPTCISSKYFKCNTCHEWHHKASSIEDSTHNRLKLPGLWRSYRSSKSTDSFKTCITCFKAMKTTHKEYRVFECKHCNEVSNNITLLTKDDGSHLDYCKSCETRVFLCAECGKFETRGKAIVIVNSSTIIKVCDTCVNTKYSYCNTCDQYILTADYNREACMCNHCFSTRIVCESCGRYTATHQTISNKRICTSCARNSGKCDVCNTTVLKLYNYENAGGKYCRKCASSRLLGRTESYSYKPYPIMHGKSADLFMGFENEISVKSERNIQINIAKILSHFTEDQLYIKSDSSVQHGFEEVSHPFTFPELKKINWEYLFTDQTTRHSSCGLHVHLNRTAFTTLHMYKFINFIHNNEVFMDKLAGRKGNSYSKSLQYTPKEGAKKKKGWDRYNKVNLNTEHTIELRFFAGCNDLYHLMYRLEFCHALYIFSKDNSEKNMSKDSFISFVTSNQRDYPHLSDYFTA